MEHRRSKAEPRLVPTPSHIEFVNKYVHRGKVEEWDEHLLANNILGKGLDCTSEILTHADI